MSLLDAVARCGVFDLEHERRLLDALSRVRTANVDFVGAWLAASAKEAGETVASFDQDFSKFADVEWCLPK